MRAAALADGDADVVELIAAYRALAACAAPGVPGVQKLAPERIVEIHGEWARISNNRLKLCTMIQDAVLGLAAPASPEGDQQQAGGAVRVDRDSASDETVRMLQMHGRHSGDSPLAVPVQADRGEPQGWREKVRNIANWLDGATNTVQTGPDDYGYASQFDHDLAQAAAELGAIADAPAPLPLPVGPSEQPSFLRPTKWTLLMTGDNHGLAAEFGCKFEHSPAHYERVDVVSIGSLAAAPVAPPASPNTALWILTHNGKQVTGQQLKDVFLAADTLRTEAEQLLAAERLMAAIDAELAEEAATAPPVAPSPDIASMVNRFLGWKLPTNFQPDAGISFVQPRFPNSWPIGTNLMSADQAKAMFEYCLALPGSTPTTQGDS
jgi:hypothetical protein